MPAETAKRFPSRPTRVIWTLTDSMDSAVRLHPAAQVDHFHLKEEIHNGSQADEDETSCMESVSQEGVPEGRVSRTPLMDNVTGMVSKLSDAASFDLINGHFLKPLFHRTDIHDDCTPPRNVELTTLGTLTEQTATTSTSPPP